MPTLDRQLNRAVAMAGFGAQRFKKEHCEICHSPLPAARAMTSLSSGWVRTPVDIDWFGHRPIPFAITRGVILRMAMRHRAVGHPDLVDGSDVLAVHGKQFDDHGRSAGVARVQSSR